VLAVLVEGLQTQPLNRSHFLFPDFTVGIAIALSQPVLTLTALTMALPSSETSESLTTYWLSNFSLTNFSLGVGA
jgi:hypothetical protein